MLLLASVVTDMLSRLSIDVATTKTQLLELKLILKILERADYTCDDIDQTLVIGHGHCLYCL